MKARLLPIALAWLALITALHVHLNVGWATLADHFRVTLGGEERQELVVGFLPVT